MFNSTVRKCSETHARVRVASGWLPIVLALIMAQLTYAQAPQVPSIFQGQLLTTKGVPVATRSEDRRVLFRSVASGWLPIVLALIMAQLTYAQAPQVPSIFQGQLLTTKGVPVANAMVQWSFVGASGPSQTGASDSAGKFAFEMPLSIPTQVQIATTANLYTPTQTSALIKPGTTTQVPAITLTRKPSGQYGAVLGAVRNSNGLAIPNATVSILRSEER